MRGSRGCSKCCTVGAEIPCESRQGKISRQRHLHKSTEADSLPFSVYIRKCCCGKSSGKSLTVAAPGAAQSHTYSKSIQRPEHIQQHCCGESSREVYQTSQQRLTHSHSQSEVGSRQGCSGKSAGKSLTVAAPVAASKVNSVCVGELSATLALTAS